jgi:hypothetical protein
MPVRWSLNLKRMRVGECAGAGRARAHAQQQRRDDLGDDELGAVGEAVVGREIADEHRDSARLERENVRHARRLDGGEVLVFQKSP